MTRIYGWKPDLPDVRDLYLEKRPLLKKVLTSYPEEFDLEDTCTPVEDQETIGSCVLNGIVGSIEQIDHMEDDKWVELSRLFGYWIAREDKDQDTGVYIRDTIKIVAKYGLCDESFWPYDVRKFRDRPSEQAFKDALKKKGIKYYRISDEDRYHGIMSTLVERKRLVIFGFAVYSNFESRKVAETGRMEMPTKEELALGMKGGHCVDIVGYKKFCGVLYFKCRNSYSNKWGLKGYFWMPAEYVLNVNLSCDFWVIFRLPKVFKEEGAVDIHTPDVKWYLPITGAYRFIKTVWEKIFRKKEVSDG